jgi:hypothetical protein
MMEIEAMTNQEVQAELAAATLSFTADDFKRLDIRLRFRALHVGWKGDPLRQPPRCILREVRYLQALKETT